MNIDIDGYSGNFQIELYDFSGRGLLTSTKNKISIKDEIVNSGIVDKKILENKGSYVNTSDFKKIIKNKPEDITILDVRSNYEHNIGKFKDAITLDIDNFRDFPGKINEIKKKIKRK